MTKDGLDCTLTDHQEHLVLESQSKRKLIVECKVMHGSILTASPNYRSKIISLLFLPAFVVFDISEISSVFSWNFFANLNKN